MYTTGGTVRGGAAPPMEAMKEIKLWANSKERERYENMAEMASIIRTTERLERAYVRDSITEKQYTPACNKLIAQFKTARTTCKDSVPDVYRFIVENKMDCPAAAHRLLNIGVPATTEHGNSSTDGDPAKAAMHVAEAVQYFITAMDSLKLNMVSVDIIHPLLTDLLESLNKVATLPADFEGKAKVKDWLSTLNKMKAHDELTEEQVRQLLYELEQSYNAFHRFLQSSK